MLVATEGDEAQPRQRMKRIPDRDILRQNSGSMSPLRMAERDIGRWRYADPDGQAERR